MGMVCMVCMVGIVVGIPACHDSRPMDRSAYSSQPDLHNRRRRMQDHRRRHDSHHGFMVL